MACNIMELRNNPVLSVVIPVYNDANGLRSAILASLTVLESIGIPFEILIVADASTDDTRKVAEEFVLVDSRIILDHSDVRRGKGGALMDALCKSHGEIFCFYDVDLSTDLAHLCDFIEKVYTGADIVIGSRTLPGSSVMRCRDRDLTSKGFNGLVRLLLGSQIQDHQCGFKSFRKDRLMELAPYIHTRDWLWDTEVLVLAQQCGYRIFEFPVTWRQGDNTCLKISDIFSMGLGIIQLTWRIRVMHDYPNFA